MKKLCSFFILFACLSLSFGQSIIEPEILNKLQASVYEVVVNKPSEGTIEYEKELPFSKLPFAIRTDKYEPIGTAFLTEDVIKKIVNFSKTNTLVKRKLNKNFKKRLKTVYKSA